MKAIIAGLCVATLLVATGPARAGNDRAGTTSANFLAVGSGAAVLGMSGATLGLGSDLQGAAWNPAALGWMNETQIVLSHVGLADESKQEWAGVGGRVSHGPMHWALSGLYQSEGTFEGRDASNQVTSDFGASSMALDVRVARTLGRSGSAGVAVKYVSEKLGQVTGSGVTFDFGAAWRAGMLGFGVAGQNVGGKMSYDGSSYPFPTSYGAGVALAPRGMPVRLALDANFPTAYLNDVRAGVDWSLAEHIVFRAGYRMELSAPEQESLSGPSFGLGAGAHGLWMDYAYVLPTGGAGQHRIGIALHPGGTNFGDPFGQKGMRREFDPPATAKDPVSKSPQESH